MTGEHGDTCDACQTLDAEAVAAYELGIAEGRRLAAEALLILPGTPLWHIAAGEPLPDAEPSGVPEEKTRFGVCGNEREPDGEVCTEVLYYASGEVQMKCPRCGAWQGIHSRPREVSGD